jgi:hypothetical protein
MEPSEIYETLRNDGRSVHHRNEAEKAIARLEARLGETRQLLQRSIDCAVDDSEIEHTGGS